MKKWKLLVALFGLSCLLFSACKENAESEDIFEEIRTSPVIKLESQQDTVPIYIDNVGSAVSIADMRIEPSSDIFDQEWIYRFTYSPKEKVINGEEIILLFGSDSMSINGTSYQPEPGVDYSSILEWAEGLYQYSLS